MNGSTFEVRKFRTMTVGDNPIFPDASRITSVGKILRRLSLDELPQLSDPLKCMYLFIASIPGTILGAIITLTSDVLYPTYARAPRVWGITASDDQIIAGLSMWIGGALIYLALLTVFFFHWLHDDEFASSQDTRPSIS